MGDVRFDPEDAVANQRHRRTKRHARSRAFLEDLTQAPVDIVAYPYGHFDRRVLDATDGAGYRAGYIFLNGRVVPGVDRLRLPRLCMGEWQDRKRLAVDLARGPDAWPPSQVDAHRG